MTAGDRVPPGQALTRKYPVVGEKAPAPQALDLAAWRLAAEGLIDPPFALTYEEILSLPQRELTADIHCVTGWTQLDMRFTGIPLADLLAARGARALPESRFVRFVAWSDRGHDTSLPLDRALADTWLVHTFDGRPLAPEHGYPLRTVTPSRYFYKSLKWVHRIEFLAEDHLGYWERESSYHNHADPWPGNERYVSGSHTAEEIERFRTAKSYVPYRGLKSLLLSADLRGWAPATSDLGNLYLKDCDLRGAHLDGVDLREANLTRCDLGGASLRGADLRGADLEGASFLAADLTGADLRGAALSATKLIGAKIDGLRWSEDAELLEDQERYLRGGGV
ncbi:MAG TPA: molybdopterin-dependent oxidoreductase [Thermoanaerobaculia bacterium]|jgi:DMSO/TMAO reductase YedYZ molybdopterin-dependent catalytic subunit|nr:molybdopterin-dependent oxidoreductase [Thermoanaerobaculia bacterium]